MEAAVEPEPEGAEEGVPPPVLTAAARAAPRWVPDAEASSCMLCKPDWQFWNTGLASSKRHHCRYCGWVVCKSCLSCAETGKPLTLAVDRWVSIKAEHAVHQLENGATKEKQVCRSCYEHAPAEISARQAPPPEMGAASDTTWRRGTAILTRAAGAGTETLALAARQLDRENGEYRQRWAQAAQQAAAAKAEAAQQVAAAQAEAEQQIAAAQQVAAAALEEAAQQVAAEQAEAAQQVVAAQAEAEQQIAAAQAEAAQRWQRPLNK
jgi:hypothetical protein